MKLRDGVDSQCYVCRRERARESYHRTREQAVPPKKQYRAPAQRLCNDDGEVVAKACMDCGEMKPLEAFAANKRAKDGRTSYCKPCHNARGRTSKDANGGARNYHLRRRYGIDAGEFEAIAESQGGRCAACRTNEPQHVDHDHETGEVRGILCFTCNVALGNVSDDVLRLEGLAGYLLRSQRRIVSVLELECPRPLRRPLTGVRALLRDETPRWDALSLDPPSA